VTKAMIMFLSIYLLIYGGVHVYLYFRFHAAFLPGLHLKIAVSLLLLFMVLCPVLIRFAERLGYEKTACLLSYIGYLWMGFAFLFFTVSLVLDIYRLLLHLGGLAGLKPSRGLMPAPLFLFLFPAIVSFGINLYGYFEAQQVRTERMEVRTSRMPPGRERLRVVQISDVHVGMIVREDRLARIMEVVKEVRPDILVSTGDLVDGQIDSIYGSLDLLRHVQATYGKYAVTGNHEFFAGIKQALQFTYDAGFTVLQGEEVNIGGLVRLVGIDDPTSGRMGNPPHIREGALVSPVSRSPLFTILLKHQPHVRQESLGGFDLQLSGHTHNGQIFPFRLITGLFFPRQNGYHELSGGSALYVNRGAGTWGPPIRFLSPPEVTVIDIVNSK